MKTQPMSPEHHRDLERLFMKIAEICGQGVDFGAVDEALAAARWHRYAATRMASFITKGVLE